jgi:segregation and condensation protein B
MKQRELDKIVEAFLFASDDPMSVKDIVKYISEVDAGVQEVSASIDLLKAEYESSERAFTVVEIGEGWQLRTKDVMNPWVNRLLTKKQSHKLSQRALETLAIVAYNQPITKGRIESIRGVNSDGIVRSLLEKELVTIIGREKTPGNPMLYSVTKDFLTHFGLKSTKDLPQLKEIDELLKTDENLIQQIKETMAPEQLGIQFEKK